MKSAGKRRSAAAVLTAAALAAASPALGGPVRVTLVNGTTGEPGRADLLTLYRLGQGMEPVASLEDAGASAVLEAPAEAAPENFPRPYLLQATYAGVNYNQPVRLDADGSAEAALTVYDPFDRWEDGGIALTTWRALYRRLPRAAGAAADTLRADHIFVIENRTAPPRTFASDGETLRFRLPGEDALVGIPSVSATGASGMPVPQSPFPVETAAAAGNDYAVRTAFKPGETEIVLSYEVEYPGERHEASLVAPRDSPEVLLLAAPADMTLALPDDASGPAAAGWEFPGPDPDAGLNVARKFGVRAGEPVRMVFAGGSPAAADAGPAAFSAPPARPAPGGGALPPVEAPGAPGDSASPVGTIGVLPDPTRAGKWALALLMAAALGFGLLHRAFGGPSDPSGGGGKDPAAGGGKDPAAGGGKDPATGGGKDPAARGGAAR